MGGPGCGPAFPFSPVGEIAVGFFLEGKEVVGWSRKTELPLIPEHLLLCGFPICSFPFFGSSTKEIGATMRDEIGLIGPISLPHPGWDVVSGSHLDEGAIVEMPFPSPLLRLDKERDKAETARGKE